MVRVEGAFLSVGRPRGDDAVHFIAFGDHDNEDATGVCLAEMDDARFPVPEHHTCVDRIVFYYLLCLFRCHIMAGDMGGIGFIPVELHRKQFLGSPARRKSLLERFGMGLSFAGSS